MPSRHKLLDTPVRFELTTDQVTGIANEDLRDKRGIAALADKIVENPYVLFEQDKGAEYSEPMGLETIDQGMWPEGDAALFRKGPPVSHDDRRRVRATACAVLRQAANAGDTLLPFETFMRGVHECLPEKRRCLADREVFWEAEDRKFHGAILWLKEEPYPESWRTAETKPKSAAAVAAAVEEDLVEDLGAGEPEDEAVTPEIRLIALKSVCRQEVEISKVLEGMGKVEDLPQTVPDWRAPLTRPNERAVSGNRKRRARKML